ncbi:MAG: hypothetical protein WA140_11800 [Geobacteraceae bacterium]
MTEHKIWILETRPLWVLPVIRALHEKYPGARIDIMVGSAATASLFTHNPLVQATWGSSIEFVNSD